VPNKIPPNETLSLYKRRLSEKRGNIDLIKRGKIDCLEKYIYPWSNPSAAPCDTGLRKF